MRSRVYSTTGTGRTWRVRWQPRAVSGITAGRRPRGNGRKQSLTSYMTIYRALVLIATGVGGGLAASVASIASVVSYPALLALGLPPLAANVTNTMALVFTVPGSMLGSRQELAGQRARIARFGAVMAAGGAAGAAVLLLAPPGAFALVVPVLIAASSILLLLQPRLRSLGCRRSRIEEAAISTGTTSANAPGGASSRTAAPAAPPAAMTAPNRAMRARCPASSCLEPSIEPGTVKTRAIVLVTLAASGGRPSASSAG